MKINKRSKKKNEKQGKICFKRKRKAKEIIKKKDNYNKPICGMARFHFAYPWFKTLHFAHLNFNPLPTSIKIKGKNVFYLHFHVSLL